MTSSFGVSSYLFRGIVCAEHFDFNVKPNFWRHIFFSHSFVNLLLQHSESLLQHITQRIFIFLCREKISQRKYYFSLKFSTSRNENKLLILEKLQKWPEQNLVRNRNERKIQKFIYHGITTRNFETPIAFFLHSHHFLALPEAGF